MIESDVIIFDSMNNQLWGMPGPGWTEEVTNLGIKSKVELSAETRVQEPIKDTGWLIKVSWVISSRALGKRPKKAQAASWVFFLKDPSMRQPGPLA